MEPKDVQVIYDNSTEGIKSVHANKTLATRAKDNYLLDQPLVDESRYVITTLSSALVWMINARTIQRNPEIYD